MKKKKIHKIDINLSSLGKQTVSKVVYGWTINAGRAIIIGIELIALSALGYRFMIDGQIVDLHEKIKTEETYISARSSEEKTYRSIQSRLLSIKNIENETKSKINIMNEILQAISSGTFFSTNMSIAQQSITIEGNTFTPRSLTDFLDNLKKFPDVIGISIDEIATSGESIRFKASISIKQTNQVALK